MVCFCRYDMLSISQTTIESLVEVILLKSPMHHGGLRPEEDKTITVALIMCTQISFFGAISEHDQLANDLA